MMIDTEAIQADLFGINEQKAQAAVEYLAELGDQALDIISPYLNGLNPDQRWWAVRALAAIPSHEATRLLVEALNDPDLSVQHCAALGLAGRPEEPAITALISSLSSPDSLLARLAANGLVRTGTPAVPCLLEALAENKPTHRSEIVRALALIGDPRAIPALFEIQEDDSYLVEYWVDEGLERMGVGMVYFKP